MALYEIGNVNFAYELLIIISKLSLTNNNDGIITLFFYILRLKYFLLNWPMKRKYIVALQD